mgnify:CR=1 FL=1
MRVVVKVVVVFFKQKTAYEILSGLVGSEMCIRDRELRGFRMFSTKIQKARISRNPKTGEKVNTLKKKTIHFKMSKEMFKKLNNDE